MISYKVLDAYNTTNLALRRYFTSQKEDEPFTEKRRDFLRWVEDIINEGIDWSLRHYYLYGAADLMWDSSPITPENIPLTLYAQGRIKFDDLNEQLSKLSVAEKFIEKKVEDGKEVKRLNVGRLHEVVVNIGRSYISRRAFAQTNKYNNLFPFFKYDTLSQTQVAKVKGEVMSQYAEIMANSYGYRHQHTQAIRDMLLYGHSVVLPVSSWERDVEIIEGKDEESLDPTVERPADSKLPLESRISREGVPFSVVHPTRVFHDRAYPLSSVNTDSGCNWIGFWDVRRYRDIRTNELFFNRERINYSTRTGSILAANKSYFDLYFADSPVNFPKIDRGAVTIGQGNDLKAQQDVYSKNTDNNSVFFTDLRIKVIPKEWGMGDYPLPVWLRLLVAADNTVIFAEWMPSSVPAAVFSHNEKDDRVNSLSMAHEIMPWQDQLSNLMSNLLLVMKHSLLRIIAINKDVVDPDTMAKIENELNGTGYYSVPHLLKYSLEKYQTLGLNPQGAVVDVVQQKAQDDYVNMTFRAIVQILSIVERLMILSPQELGQPAPREITAQEVTSIETATSAVYSAISESIDEARAAWKRIVYESTVAKASKDQFVPVSQTFSQDTIEKAGFEVVAPENESSAKGTAIAPTFDVMGNLKSLQYDYVFTGRDGGERIQNLQSAQLLIQLLQQVIPLVGPTSFKRQQLYDIVNEAFRLVGLYDLKLEMAEGDPQNLGPDDLRAELQQIAAQMQQQVQQAQAGNAQNQAQIKMVANAVTQLTGIVERAISKAPATPDTGLPIQKGEVAPGVPGLPPLHPAPLQPQPVAMMPPLQPMVTTSDALQ